MTIYMQNSLTANYGESLVALFLSMCGFKAEKSIYGCGDLTVNNLCIEVKTANKSSENTWKATLESKTRRGITANVDFVVLVAIVDSENVFFIIPADVVRGKRAIKITSNPLTYHGKLAQYRFAWESILEELKNDRN